MRPSASGLRTPPRARASRIAFVVMSALCALSGPSTSDSRRVRRLRRYRSSSRPTPASVKSIAAMTHVVVSATGVRARPPDKMVCARFSVRGRGHRLREDVGEAALLLRETELPRDPPARAHPGLHEVRIRGTRDEQVRPRHDPGADFEYLELESVRHNRLEAEGPDHAPEQADRLLDDPLPHLERLGEQRLPEHDGEIPRDHERRVQSVLPQRILRPELVHLVDVRLVAPVDSEHLEGPAAQPVPVLDERGVEVMDVVPGPDHVLLDRVLLPWPDRLPKLRLRLRDERALPALRPVVFHEHGPVDLRRATEPPRHVHARGEEPLPLPLPV